MIRPFTGADLLRMRRGLRMSQVAFGEKVGISDSTLHRWEAEPNLDLPKTARLAISAWVFGLPPFQGGNMKDLE